MLKHLGRIIVLWLVTAGSALAVPPTITLHGSSPMSWPQGVPFVDPGATAQDDVDGAVVLVGSGVVNIDLPGTNTLTYRYTNSQGEAAPPVTRLVRVQANNPATPPNADYVLLPNGTGDGYADYATDAFGGFRSSQCGGGLNPDGSPKPLGAAEFDPWSGGLVTDYGRQGAMCTTLIYLFALDRSARQSLSYQPISYAWEGPDHLYPDGTPLAAPVRAADLVSNAWVGVDNSVRRSRFFPHLFPGLQVDLDQRASCAALTQVYRFTNVSAAPISFRLTQVADTDLDYGSNFQNNFGHVESSDSFTSWITNQAKTVQFMMRSRPDVDTRFEGWRVRTQSSAAWDHLRAGMYYGFPTLAFGTPFCEQNPADPACPPEDHLNRITTWAPASTPNYFYVAPDAGATREVSADLNADGWSDVARDVAQSLQAVYVLQPGESREYRTLFEGSPSYCRVQTDAGFDEVVAVGSATACAATVTLDASRSEVSGNAADQVTTTWFDARGAVVSEAAQAHVTVVGAGEHTFDLRVCNGDGICDTDTVAVIATDADGTCQDSDGDGIVDALDRDDDDDGVPDTAEGDGDSDGDGLPDRLDRDSDGDGLPDLVEADDAAHDGAPPRAALYDLDGDGQIDFSLKVDLNNDGWDDRYEANPPILPDFDGDDVADFRDPDDDGDLIPTLLECPDRRPCPASPGQDGQPDYLNVAAFACQELGVAVVEGHLGAGGVAFGHWFFNRTDYVAVARDGHDGHLYALTAAGELWRVTPGAELRIALPLLPGATALAATPEPGRLVAAVPADTESTFYLINLDDGTLTPQDTLPGRVEALTFDRSGGRIVSRQLDSATQVLFPNRTVTTASLVYGLAMRPGGTLIGLTQSDRFTLRVNAIAWDGTFTPVFEPTRSWRPGLAPAAPLDFTGCQANLAPHLADDAVVTPFEVPVEVAPLLNDHDASGLDLATLAVDPASADIAQVVDDAVLITPPAGWVGPLTVRYLVADRFGLERDATITVYVAPNAVTDTAARAQGAPAATLDLAANDTGLAASTFALVAPPAWATLDGATLTLAPPATVAGSFTFAYDHCYPAPLGSVCARADVIVKINAAPVLSAAAGGTGLGGPAVVLDIANIFSDSEEDAVGVVTLVGAVPSDCALEVNVAASVVTATPGARAERCVVTLDVCDNGVPAACSTTTWTVTVNDPPRGATLPALVATGATRTWELDDLVGQVSTGVIDTGIDPDGFELEGVDTGTIVTTELGGTCTLENGQVRYIAPDLTGLDRCTLRVCENAPGAACTSVILDLTVLDALAPAAEAFVVPVGDVLTIPVVELIANDLGVAPATFALQGASGGSATVEDGAVRFTSATGGLFTFTYKICSAVDTSICVEVQDVIYVRAAPSLADAEVWVATPTADASWELGLSGPFPADPLAFTTSTPSGASATLQGNALTVTPADPTVGAVYTTNVRGCDAPGATLAVACGGPGIAYCGVIEVAPGCAEATITWVWNDPPVLSAVRVVALPETTVTVPLASLYVGPGAVSGDADGDGEALDEGATAVVSGPCAVAEGEVRLQTPATLGDATCSVRLCEERPAGACAEVTIIAEVLSGTTTAVEDRWVIRQGTSLTLDAASGPGHNDSVTPGSTFEAGALAPTGAGVVTLHASGALNFEPAADFVGEASFPYTLRDGFGRSDTALVTVVVNDPPVLTPVEREVTAGAEVEVPWRELVTSTGAWHGDDPSDGDRDGLSTPHITGPCALNGDQIVMATTSLGAGVCRVTICEEVPTEAPRACAETTVTVTVVAPVLAAADDRFVMAMGGVLSVAAPGVLENDTATQGQAALEAPVGGMVLNADGSLTFEPDVGFAGEVNADYHVEDGYGRAYARITVVVNDPPTLQALERVVAPGGTARLDVAALVTDLGVVAGDDAEDGDRDGIGRVQVSSGSEHCAVEDGQIVITAGGPGTVTCTIEVCEELPADDPGVCAVTTVTVQVPEALTAVDDRYVMLMDTTLSVPAALGVLANDAAPDATVSAAPIAGLSVEASGAFAMTPDVGFAGEIRWNYTADDGLQRDDAAVLVIVNDPPTGATLTTTLEGQGEARWAFTALATTLGVVDLGLDPASVVVTEGPCVVRGGEVIATGGEDATCKVRFCEYEPTEQPACSEAIIEIHVNTTEPDERDGYRASGGGGCAGSGAGGLWVGLLGVGLAWMRRRREGGRV